MELNNLRLLVLWSGGVESTSLLLRLLSETNSVVFAHFIEMVNPEGRGGAETRAIQSLLPRLQSVRPFNFSSSLIRLHDGQARGWDYAVQYPMGLFVMDHLRCDAVLRAGCLEDDWDHVSDGLGNVRFIRPDPNPGASHLRRAKRLVASLDDGRKPERVAPYLPSYQLPKAKHIEFLGDIFPLTWSCRRPVAGEEPCGKCHACLEREAASRGTSLIPEIAELLSLG